MTDRELLELAAKAAGLSHVDYTGVDYDGRSGLILTDEIGRQTTKWSPLTDDGDALRLALKLGIQIGNPYQYRKALAFIDTGHGVDWEYREHWEDFDGEPYAATRRAIVRAAAELQRQKERK